MRQVSAVLRALLLLTSAIVPASCGGSSPTGPTTSPPSTPPTAALTPVSSAGDWPVSSLEAEHLDASRLGDLALRIRRRDYGNITSVLIARHGRLVFEEYFNGWSMDQAHTMQSVTKSVVSLLTGLAAASGALSVDDPVTQFFPGYQPIANADARKSAMTVRDLLTMRTGLDWSEDPYAGSPLQRLNDCRCDWIRFVLDWRMRDQPGSRWEYVSGGTILLGAIIGAATGERLDRLAEARLFGPLGAAGVSWYQGLPDGLPHGGGGLNLRPRDAAKLGQLVADGGRWQGRPIVDGGWIRQTTARSASGLRTWEGHTFDYASLWWLTSDAGDDIITASGALGQWIFVSPRRQLVVVATGQNDDFRATAAVGFLFSHVLPSVGD
jgi:CubicO group peptidase (beta-lactamase class C family)